MSTKPEIEYSGSSRHMTPEQMRIKLRNAPAWVLQRAGITSRAAAAPPARPRSRPPATAAARSVIGWVAGTICPAVSNPAYSSGDGRTLPEQFTDVCMRAMLRQATEQTKPIALRWGHRGPVIATTRNLDVLFTIKSSTAFLTGLEFEARLRLDDELHRRVLAAGADGLGVSIGYVSTRQSIVQRDGIGEVRVIHECVLDHVAVLPPDANLRAAYPAARCYAGKGRWMACPVELRSRARLDAYAVWKRQAGARS